MFETRQRLHHQGFDKYKRIKHKIQLIKWIEKHAIFSPLTFKTLQLLPIGFLCQLEHSDKQFEN